MPFGLKLKKSRHYKVMSKSLFVLSIQLLDSATIDCTLSSESTGQECLENVCQRISIGQPEFFGLRYIVKGSKDEVRWVDLERPLNRQLEKYAADTKTLYLRVMYYVISGVSLINDEVTRNYYFLQLKHDIVEGKISCEPKQAVMLGNFSRQAEYGNHQDRHTVEYLKSLLSFPKHLIEAGLLETLTEEVIKQHAELHNVAQGAAEEFYISRCQQLDGYGQETFTAKDEMGNEVMLGISVSGIIVACTDSHKFYPWRDISNVVNHKRTFNIECTTPENSVGFTLSDAETGRYVWKLCVLQHTFFMKYEQNQTHPTASQMNLFSNVPENLNDSRDDLLAEQHQLQHQQQQQMLSNWQASTETQISSATTNSNSQNNNTWSTPESTPITASNMSMATSSQPLMQSRNSLQASALDVNQLTSMIPWGGGMNGINSGSNASLINRAQSSSCLDLSNNNNNNTSSSSTNVNQDRERLKALLPTYRPAPDYETAVQQKYHASSNELRFSANPLPIQQPQLFQQPIYNPAISGSQPDVHSANTKLMQMYPDVTHHTNTGHLLTSDLTQQFKMMKFVKPAPPPYAANRLSSTSTPDLALASHRALLGGYPPHIVSGSSPDLVSSRTFVSHHPQHQPQHAIYHHHPHMAPQNHQIFYAANANGGGGTRLRHSHSFLPHGTYENLNFLEPSAATKTSLLANKHHHNLQNVYDAGNNVIYCLPRGVEMEHILLQQNGGGGGPSAANPMLHQLSSSNQQINGSIEPIYENIPLPQWNKNEVVADATMRDRASSVQSVPSVIRKQQMYAEKPLPPTPNVPPQFSGRFQTPSERTESLLAASNKLNTHPAITKTNSNPVVNNSNNAKSTIATAAPTPPIPNSRLAMNNDIKIPKITTTPPPAAILNNNNNNNNNNVSSKKHATIALLSQSASDLDNNNKSHTSSSARIEPLNRSTHSSIIDTSTNSSTYTMNTTTNTTDSGISSMGIGGGSGKEKRSRKIWQILGGGRSKSSSNRDGDKQKSATLGREKDKHAKKGASGKTNNRDQEPADPTIRHRWSTGLPRLQPLPTNVSKESLCQQLEAKLTDSQLWSEFERIPKRKENAKFECALHEENNNRNLDPKYLPYDDNRVRITPSRDNRMGYVNASYITSTVGTKQRFYIAAQTPHNLLASPSFWQCVWETDIYLLVQLSDEVKYVPPNSERCLEYGQYQVWREFSQENDRCVTSKLRVYHTQSRRYRSIWHLSYSDWGEHDTPKDVANFYGFLEELNSVRLASIGEIPPGHNTNPPVLIHCSEGGGRSGVTLLADLLLYTMDHNQDLDIPRVVGQLRQQRDNIIPSLAQYKFIYALLIHYLKQTRLI